MATSTSNHHLAPPPASNLGLPISNGNGIGDVSSPPLSPSRQQHPPPSPRAHSKSILTIALQKAQSAVVLDSANNVSAALAAYKQTVKLLLQVIDKAANETDRRRLQHINEESNGKLIVKEKNIISGSDIGNMRNLNINGRHKSKKDSSSTTVSNNNSAINDPRTNQTPQLLQQSHGTPPGYLSCLIRRRHRYQITNQPLKEENHLESRQNPQSL
ncbi:4235_t:CDS:2 [Ambispora gerdemannii]|uniref:4235_t:CDS:1 n=1 Tax=Ambispora gerdemannii TaxID=144530 RepID=A0A9N8WF28_9GLOM|nr:4235_t:CDS:2 [Ambispora gerdemannii]